MLQRIADEFQRGVKKKVESYFFARVRQWHWNCTKADDYAETCRVGAVSFRKVLI